MCKQQFRKWAAAGFPDPTLYEEDDEEEEGNSLSEPELKQEIPGPQ